MGILLTTLTRFVGTAGKAFKVGGNLHQVFAGIFRTLRMGLPILTGFIGMIGGAFLSVIGKVVSVFQDAIKEALGFELSIKGLLEQAEKARKYYSELGDELNYFSDKTGSTAEAQKILMHGFKKSAGSMSQVKTVMQSMVDAGADNGTVMKNLIADLVDLEIATGVAGTTFSQFSIKMQQTFKKKGIEKDILSLQKAIAGTGLRTTNLEQVFNGLTESLEKLAFATRGESLDFMNLGREYGKFAATLKQGFGINTQTTSNFINNLLDPENIDKNMLLLNKLGYSYEEYNNMLNTGKGQEIFFDKVLNNIGKVASEANMIEDAATRYKYLKETLGLPPEIANKLLNLEPYALREEAKRIKREMEEAEKRKKIKDKLKQKEEKYQEQLDFIRFNMVAPLMDFIIKNRKTMMEMMTALKPVIQGLSKMLNEFLLPFNEWFNGFNKDLTDLNNTIGNLDEKGKADKIAKFIRKSFLTLVDTMAIAFVNVWNSEQVQGVIIPIARSLGRLLRIAMKYATGNIFGKKGWDQASKEVDEDDEKDKRVKISNLTGMSHFTARKGGDSDLYKEGDVLGSGLRKEILTKEKADEYNQKRIESYANDLKEKYKNVGVGVRSLALTNEDYKELAEFRLKKDDDKTLKKIREMIRKFSLSNTDQAKKNIENLMELQSAITGVSDFTIKYDRLYKEGEEGAGGTSGTITNPKFSAKQNETLSKISQKLTSKDFKEGIALIKSDPTMLAAFSKEFASTATAQLSNLEKQISIKDQQIINLSNQMSALNKRLTDMEDSPIVKMLKSIRDGIVGPGGMDHYAQYSVKELLSVIAESVDDSDRQYSSKTKNTSISNNSKNLFTDAKFSTSSENAVLPNQSSAGWVVVKSTAIEAITNAATKNLVVKQTLYLRAIAESTYSTAYYTRLLSHSLIYTTKGLAVYLPQLDAGIGGSSGNNLLGYSARGFNVKLPGAPAGSSNPFAVMGETVVSPTEPK